MDTLTKVLAQFGHVLSYGVHAEGEEAVCAIELLAIARGLSITDDHNQVRCYDLRPLNDAPWSSDVVRTTHLLPVLRAYDGSMDWPACRQLCVTESLVLLTVQQIISQLPGLPANSAAACREATTLQAAAEAARAAQAATWAAGAAAEAAAGAAGAAALAARAAAWAAGAAAEAAAGAARAAAWAAGAAAWAAGAAAEAADIVLITACQLWLEAALQ